MSSLHLLRTRWAAIGAAVAVTLGAGGFVAVEAAVTSGERTVFVPITPCRLVDTRPATAVGPKTTPLGAGETHTVTAHGTTGDCTIPTDAVALSLNVTAIGATAPTFLAIWPAGADRPDASSLNPSPGQPPTPNAVTTDLSTDGRFSIFNLQGGVDVLVDVNGYYADHNHDDRYYTKTQVDAALATKAGAATSKWISIDPMSVRSGGGASVASGVGSNAGLQLPGGPTDLPTFEFGFTIPPDHTLNTPLTIELLWHINQTGCTVSLRTNFVSVARRGEQHRGTGLSPLVADPVPSVANQTARTTFQLDTTGFGTAPGDAVIAGLFRSFVDDTCAQPLLISGIRVVYT